MRSDQDHESALQLALECLAASGSLKLRVTGTSMLPAIRPGSFALIRRVSPAEINPGDIVLARTSTGVRLHRLLEIQGSGTDAVWVTRGDNNEHCDPPLSPGQFLGVLISVEQSERVSWFRRIASAGLRHVRPA